MMTVSNPMNIESTYVILESGGGSTPVEVTETFWSDLASRAGGFSDKRLVACFAFDSDWNSWERHPEGEEWVCLLSGAVDFVMETDDGEKQIRLDQPGSFAIVPLNTWHTASVREPSTMLFITPGDGTEHRPR